MSDWAGAFAFVGLVASFFGFMAYVLVTDNDNERAIAVACVQSGGEWKQPSWMEPKGCVREASR